MPFWLELFRPSPTTARQILRSGLPPLSVLDDAQVRRPTMLLFGTGQGEERPPQTLFQTVLPFLVRQPEELAAPEPGHWRIGPVDSAPETPPRAKPPAAEAEKETPATVPLVGIYHTHDWESFISEHPHLEIKSDADLAKVRTLNETKNILRIGKMLGEQLASAGVVAVQNPRSHEEAGYDYAYAASRKTAKQILSEHPTVRILLDIHRDAVGRELSTFTWNGKPAARIQIVLGKGRDELPHPRWKENHAFAQVLHAAMERKYPGLSRGILLKDDRYNQDLLPGAVLLEVGSAVNTMQEAEEAARLFADVLQEVIARNNYPR